MKRQQWGGGEKKDLCGKYLNSYMFEICTLRPGCETVAAPGRAVNSPPAYHLSCVLEEMWVALTRTAAPEFNPPLTSESNFDFCCSATAPPRQGGQPGRRGNPCLLSWRGGSPHFSIHLLANDRSRCAASLSRSQSTQSSES